MPDLGKTKDIMKKEPDTRKVEVPVTNAARSLIQKVENRSEE